MAHVEDRWEKVVNGQRVRTGRYGSGMRWRARYLDPEGRERSQTFARRVDAERFVATITADVLRGTYVDPDAGRVTFQVFADAWLESRTFDDSTREATELRMRLHTHPLLGHWELRALRPSLLQAWLRELERRLSARYVRVIFANVSSILSAAVDDGLIARNPCQAGSVRPPRVEVRRIEPWTAEQVLAVTAALPIRYAPLATVAAGCGLRQGEVFGLRVEDVDLLRRRVNVEQQVKLVHGRIRLAAPKGAKTRHVPLPDHVAEALAGHLQRFPTGEGGLLFHTREHNPIHRSHFNRNVWKPALEGAGIEPSRQNGMHALRHFYASVLIDAGESVKAVAEYLGHADPGFTLRVYAHLLPSSEDRTRRAVDTVLGGAREALTQAGTDPSTPFETVAPTAP